MAASRSTALSPVATISALVPCPDLGMRPSASSISGAREPAESRRRAQQHVQCGGRNRQQPSTRRYAGTARPPCDSRCATSARTSCRRRGAKRCRTSGRSSAPRTPSTRSGRSIQSPRLGRSNSSDCDRAATAMHAEDERLLPVEAFQDRRDARQCEQDQRRPEGGVVPAGQAAREHDEEQAGEGGGRLPRFDQLQRDDSLHREQPGVRPPATRCSG